MLKYFMLLYCKETQGENVFNEEHTHCNLEGDPMGGAGWINLTCGQMIAKVKLAKALFAWSASCDR